MFVSADSDWLLVWLVGWSYFQLSLAGYQFLLELPGVNILSDYSGTS